jgi:large subunit ribosomal protein L16
MKGISCRGNHICFGGYALQALSPLWITARQREAGRRAMTRYARRGGKIWVFQYISRQTEDSKTYGNTYGFGEGIPRILGIRC